MALDELTEFFAVFIAHVHEFDAAAVGADVADHRSEIDFAETGADLQLDRVADSKSSRRLQISAAKADCFYARKARGCALDLGTKRRVQWNSGVASRDNVTGARLPRRAESGRCLFERRTILDQCQRIFRCGPQTGGVRIGKALAAFRQRAKKLGGFAGTHAAKGFDGLYAHKLVAQNLVFTGGDFHELRHGSCFLSQAELVDHHGNDHGMCVGEDGGKDKGGAQGRSRIVGTRKFADCQVLKVPFPTSHGASERSEERRVGKECRSRWSPYH